jgi:hypothetical protein
MDGWTEGFGRKSESHACINVSKIAYNIKYKQFELIAFGALL